MTKRRILIISLDVVSENMAGPAIRCWEFARALSHEAQVTLAIPNPTTLAPPGFTLAEYDEERLQALALDSDLVILSGHTFWFYPFLKKLDIPLVVDIYDPFLLESLPLLSNRSEEEQDTRYTIILDALTDLLTWGDFFVCASERQRDYWLGWLNALNRINPATYRAGPDLRHLVDVVSFGLPDEPPQHTRTVLKGVHPGISAADRVVVWGGGVYDWFDPLTLIRAMERIAAQRQGVKLFFLGICHPTHGTSGSEMAEKAIALSQHLGLYDQQVFFNDWVPYDDRQNYLLEADLGVSLHFPHLETHFSFRTRLLDYIWTGLPMIVSQGDVLSDLVEKERLGWKVGYEDIDAVTDAILQGLNTPRREFQDRFAAVAQELTWDKVLQPLITFCREPQLAPDRYLKGNDLHSLPALKLISEIDALRRDVNKRDEQVATLNHALRQREARIANYDQIVLTKEGEIANLHKEIANLHNELERLRQVKDTEIQRLTQHIEHIRQGRVMRLLNSINHFLKGTPLE